MAANVHNQPVPAKTSPKARTQPLYPKRASHSAPIVHLQCPSSPNPKPTSSGRAMPVAVTGGMCRASLERLHDEELRIMPPKVTRAVSSASPEPLGRFYTAPSKASEERRATAAAKTSKLSTTTRTSEPPKATCNLGQFARPGRRLSTSSGLMPRHTIETTPTGATHDPALLDTESQSMVLPTNRGSVFRRLVWPVLKKPQSPCTSTPSLTPSASRARSGDVKSATPSPYIVNMGNVGSTSSRDTQVSTVDESRSQVMKALFLNLFMFAASVLCIMAFFRLSDVAHDVYARGGNPATTGLPTVAPPDDFVANIAPRHIPGVVDKVNHGTEHQATDATLTTIEDASIAASQRSNTAENTTENY